MGFNSGFKGLNIRQLMYALEACNDGRSECILWRDVYFSIRSPLPLPCNNLVEANLHLLRRKKLISSIFCYQANLLGLSLKQVANCVAHSHAAKPANL